MSNAQIKTIIKEMGMDLEVGSTSNGLLCPFCNGGKSKERTFSITREPSGLLYNCFRASCTGSNGFISSTSLSLKLNQKKKTFEPKKYTHPLKNLTDKQIEFFNTRWGITEKELKENWVQYSPDIDRFYFPMFDLRGFTIGGVARSYDPTVKPKTIFYRLNDVPKLHFPFSEKIFDTVVVVEDILSAIKVNRHATGCALLGTSISNEQILLLSKQFKNIIIALDPDATVVAIKYAKKFRLLFSGKVRAVNLTADPKDLTDNQIIEEIFNGRPPIISTNQ